MKVRTLALIFTGAICCSSALAMTGNDLLVRLKSTDVNENLRAYAYIQGVIEGHEMDTALRMLQTPQFTEWEKVRHAHICSPEGVTYGQIHSMVQQYLEANPADRHRAAAWFVYKPLVAAWPCKAAK